MPDRRSPYCFSLCAGVPGEIFDRAPPTTRLKLTTRLLPVWFNAAPQRFFIRPLKWHPKGSHAKYFCC